MLLGFLLQVADSTSVNSSTICCGFDVWKFIALVEFVLIILLVFYKKEKQKEMNPDLLNAKSAAIDTDSMMSDIFKSRELYEKLIRKCHPDRYVDEEMKQIMTDLSKDITKNKNNYTVLCEIRNKIDALYKITI